ncbi:hypothetical protein [Mycoplasmopsis columbina]|uniref:SMODS and SLOG-associating 2TM effector domain-containing protein n=1 Tax=Mycoplasmopsis columbina SF7 TaxID=1037410 RepID=F9UK34_9BACT|nr:hypothetical protein [Mycoplasmopsis columbina]EGV00039.1 hypothetical protein MCSF7_01226 [Mycoplasmopsis columbina SF7]VEU76935.1 Uncharacterised protein [Mycoplasmopsis columbina]
MKQNVVDKINKLEKKVNFKYKRGRYFFIALSLINIFISAAIIILNLYSIRFNTYAKETMIFFVVIAIISTVITFIISVKTFLNITDKSSQISQNIDKNQEILETLKDKNELSSEDIEAIVQTL